MKILYLVVLTLLVVSPRVFANEDFEREFAEARRQVDEAARVLGELYRQKYSVGGGEKKAMLGILLGEKPNQGGVELVGVTPSGGAATAGLQAGDVIVKLDDLSLSDAANPMKELSGYMKSVSPGDEVRVVYERDGEREQVNLITQARTAHMLSMLGDKLEKLDLDIDVDLDGLMEIPEISHAVWAHEGMSARKLMLVSGDLAEYFDVDSGVVIIDPPVDSDLKAGDVLISVGNQPIDDLARARELLNAIADKAEVQIKRHGKLKTLTVSEAAFAGLSSVSKTKVVRVETPGSGVDPVVIRVEVTED